MTAGQVVLAALIPVAVAYFAYCFHQSDRMEVEAEGWLTSFNGRQEKEQAHLLTQLMTSVLPELVDSFFGPGPIEQSPVEPAAVKNTVAELEHDPGQTDLITRRHLTEPIIRTTLPNLLERLPALAPNLVLLQAVREAVESLRCYATEDASARRRARVIANGYAVQMGAIGVVTALDAALIAIGGYPLLAAFAGLGSLVVVHAGILESRKRHLRYDLDPVAPEVKQ